MVKFYITIYIWLIKDEHPQQKILSIDIIARTEHIIEKT